MPPKRSLTIRDQLGDAMRQRAAVGVAQAQHVGAVLLARLPESEARNRDSKCSRRRNARRRRRLRLPCCFEIGDGLADEREVFFFGDSEGALRVQIPAFAENRDHRRSGLDQFPDVRILVDRIARKSGGAESSQFGVLQLQLRSRVRRTVCPWDSTPASRLRCSRSPAHRASAQSAVCHRRKKRRIRLACRPGGSYRRYRFS